MGVISGESGIVAWLCHSEPGDRLGSCPLTSAGISRASTVARRVQSPLLEADEVSIGYNAPKNERHIALGN